MTKILLIDDSDKVRQSTLRGLQAGGFAVIEARNGSDGLILAQESKPDLVITDADMPDLDGHSLCRALKRGKETSHIPIIIVSGALMEAHDVVSGLEGGADDYVLKPYPMKVLLARVNAVLRRSKRTPESESTLRQSGIELDAAGREVRVEGNRVELTRKEFDLLAVLIEKAGRVLSGAYLLDAVWGYDPADYNDDRTIETHISRLRKKLGEKASSRIVNIRGLGYKFEK